MLTLFKKYIRRRDMVWLIENNFTIIIIDTICLEKMPYDVELQNYSIISIAKSSFRERERNYL